MIISLDFLFRIAALFIFFIWWLYWNINQQRAEREIPSTKSQGALLKKQQFRRFILRFAEAIMVIQVIGIQILPLPFPAFFIQCIGFIFVLVGFSVAISARKTLAANWAHAYEYQVKSKQDLITTGMYSLVRHPIYSGLCLTFIGGELVAKSYLTLIGLLLLVGGYWQARQEETILIKHFGKAYKTYMKHTKMFLPYLW